MKKILIGIALAVLTIVFINGFAVGFIHITGLPYKAEIENLGIKETTGLDKAEIAENYDAVSDYLSPFSNAELSTALKVSESGMTHLEDCKVLIRNIYIFAAAAAILIAFMIHLGAVSKYALRLSGILTVILTAGNTAFLFVDFNRVMIVFHHLVFRDGTWLVNAKSDELLGILPSEFFFHCGCVIAAFFLLASAAEIIIGFVGNKSKN